MQSFVTYEILAIVSVLCVALLRKRSCRVSRCRRELGAFQAKNSLEICGMGNPMWKRMVLHVMISCLSVEWRPLRTLSEMGREREGATTALRSIAYRLGKNKITGIHRASTPVQDAPSLLKSSERRIDHCSASFDSCSTDAGTSANGSTQVQPHNPVPTGTHQDLTQHTS